MIRKRQTEAEKKDAALAAMYERQNDFVLPTVIWAPPGDEAKGEVLDAPPMAPSPFR